MTWILVPESAAGTPSASIDRANSYMEWGGTTFPPGSYQPQPGETITYRAAVTNTGDAEGQIVIQIWDKNASVELDRDGTVVAPGSTLALDGSFTLNQRRDIEIVAYHDEAGDLVRDDSYG